MMAVLKREYIIFGKPFLHRAQRPQLKLSEAAKQPSFSVAVARDLEWSKRFSEREESGRRSA
jgi:hypothetical protein